VPPDAAAKQGDARLAARYGMKQSRGLLAALVPDPLQRNGVGPRAALYARSRTKRNPRVGQRAGCRGSGLVEKDGESEMDGHGGFAGAALPARDGYDRRAGPAHFAGPFDPSPGPDAAMRASVRASSAFRKAFRASRALR
jgi:hypothetical protein